MQCCYAVVLLMLLVVPLGVRAEESAQSVPFDKKCSVPADERWMAQEKFVWERVCIGAIANFNEGSAYGGYLDPKKADGWPRNRVLSSAFLETILLKDPYRRTLTRRGVTIVGARFTEAVDLQGAQLKHVLGLGWSRLEKGADLRRVRSAHSIGFSGSKVESTLNMNGLHLDASLFMRDGAEFADVVLVTARVGGQLDLTASKVTGKLDMTGLHVGADLFMGSEAQFAEVSLRGAHVRAQLDLTGSKVTGKLDMDGLRVDQSLYMMDKAEFAEVNLSNAHVGGQLGLIASKMSGTFTCSSTEIQGDVYLGRGAEFAGPIVFVFGRVGGSFELAGGSFHQHVDLTGTQIAGELRLGSSRHESAKWFDNSILTLRNARADAIQDLSDAWPPGSIELTGFTYRSLGGFYAAERDPMGERAVRWFQDWLGKQQYAAAPYEQLASVLRSQGRPKEASEILYTSRERERSRAPFLRYIWLTAMSWLIGYGHHIDRALIWVAGFLIAGLAALRISGEGPRNGMPYGIAYSFDMLLPIIQLRKKHYDIDLHGWPRYYFYVHRIMGYVLASFLIAGISGLSK